MLKIISQNDISQEALKQLTKCRNEELAEAARLHVNYSIKLPNSAKIAENLLVKTIKQIDNSLLQEQLEALARIKLIPKHFITHWDEKLRTARLLYYVQKIYSTQTESEEKKKPIDDLDLIKDLKTTIDIFQKLANKGDRELNLALAQSYYTPVSILINLIRLKDTEITKAIANNPITPEAILNKLGKRNIYSAGAEEFNSGIEEMKHNIREQANFNLDNSQVELFARMMQGMKQSMQSGMIRYDGGYVNSRSPKSVTVAPQRTKQRQNIVRDFNTPLHIVEILELLATFKSNIYPIYVAALTENPNLPEHLWKLIFHYDYSISRYKYSRIFSGQNLEQFPELLPIFLTQYPQGLP